MRPSLDISPSLKTIWHARESRTPVHVLIVFPTSPMSDFRFHIPKNACASDYIFQYDYEHRVRTLYAAFSKRSSPVNRLKVANSRIKEPAPAVPDP